MELKIESRGGYAHRSGLCLLQSRSQTAFLTRDSGKRMVRGYAAVFFREDRKEETEFWLWSDMVERILPGAFERAIKEKHDARGLFNHDHSWLLGRVSSGTARVGTDETGLWYEIDEDRNDPQWQSVAAKIDRGDITGSSFAFLPKRVIWEENPDYYVRNLADLDLYDVSPVTWPAYTGTSAHRSESSGIETPHYVREMIHERQRFFAERDRVLMRARQVEIESRSR